VALNPLAVTTQRVAQQEERMPRIIVTADRPNDNVMFSERISSADLESDHFRAQLLQRLLWAVSDAHASEQARP
jgi:hypothetical protein